MPGAALLTTTSLSRTCSVLLVMTNTPKIRLGAPVIQNTVPVAPEWRRTLIAEAAYYRAAYRGFEAGHELDDWLAAEQGIDAELTAGHTPVPAAI